MIEVLSLKDNTVRTFESVDEILKEVPAKLQAQAIYSCLEGSQGSHKGYKFRLLTDEVGQEPITQQVTQVATEDISPAPPVKDDSNLAECDFTLPTMGLIYNNQIPATFPIRTLTSSEEMKLLSSTTSDAINRVLQSIVLLKDFNIKSLAPVDILALTVKSRIHTFGTEYHLLSYCPFCQFEGDFTVDLDNLETFYLKDIKLPLKLEVPVSHDVVTLRVLTAGNLETIEERVSKVVSNIGGDAEVLATTFKRAKQIVSINGKDVLTAESEKWVREAHPKDLAYIDSALNSLKVGISNKIATKCPKCGKDVVIPFTMNNTFFRPVYKEIKWL